MSTAPIPITFRQQVQEQVAAIAAREQGRARDERHLALRNAFKLSTSLAVTWTVGLAVRLLLPRYLGPDRFGAFSFADAFSASFFVVLSLGIDAHVYKTVSVRPWHVSRFFGSVLLLRLALGTLLVPGMWLVLAGTRHPTDVQNLVWIFAAALFFTGTNNTLSAVLQSRSKVDGVSILNVVGKLVWAIGLLVAFLSRAGVWAFVVPTLASEAFKTPLLWTLARRHAALRFRIDLSATRDALAASLPFYANGMAVALLGKLDVSFLATMATPTEVGYYSAATGLASLTLLLTPILTSVLFPLLARAAARSPAELDALVRRTLEFVFALAIPMALALALGGDFWTRIVFGKAFAPAVLALAIMAPTTLVTYVNLLSAYTLNALGRTWMVTLTTVSGIAANVLFNLGLLRPLMAVLDRAGGGAAACALARLASEIIVTSVMLWLIGRRAFDRQNVSRSARALAAAAVTVVVDRLAAQLGPVRLLVDTAVYATLAVAWGALRPRELAGFMRALVSGRRAEPG